MTLSDAKINLTLQKNILVLDNLIKRGLHMHVVFQVHETASIGVVLVLSTYLESDTFQLHKKVPRSLHPGKPPSYIKKVSLVYWSLIMRVLFFKCWVVIGLRSLDYGK
jgi:hypothetical protein